MRVVFRELSGQPMLAFTVDGHLRARPRFDEEAAVHADRVGKVFKERVKSAFFDKELRRFSGVELKVQVGTDRDLGLLHVAKLVSDALVEAKVLKNDRMGDVTGITVSRRTWANNEHSVELIHEGSKLASARFRAVAAEWRTPTPLTHGLLHGPNWDAAHEYHATLLADWEEIRESAGFAFEVQDLETLLEIGHNDWLTRGFNLLIGISSQRRNMDLDNVAFYALDMLTLAMRDRGLEVPLDQIVGFVSVQLQDGFDGIHVQLKFNPAHKGRFQRLGQVAFS